MRNPKVHLNGTVLFITASVEADLIFPANPLSNLIVLKCLAAAQDLYPPDAWMEAFGVTDLEDKEDLNTRTTEGLYEAEQEYREQKRANQLLAQLN